ncbi:MAG: hypothetical protein ACOYO1_15755 [Bacteroidales bacterium]
MFKYLSLLIVVLITIVLSSCETDFNPNAEYKDITVVYGLLNQSDTFTYIKINKAFLGNESAYLMAQNEDLSHYNDTILEVKMEEIVNGSITKVYNFDTTTIYNKEAGIFYAPKQILYKCYTLNQLKQNYTYNLTIKNKLSGKIISAKTSLVNRFDITRPISGQRTIDFTTVTTSKSRVEWYSTYGGKKYSTTMRINYSESNDGINYISKYIDLNLGTQTRNTTESGTEMTADYYGLIYFETLNNNLAHNTLTGPQNYFRKPGKIEFFITVAGDDLSTYIEVNQASNSIVQIRPEFTNINNGIGIFSARYITAPDHPRIMDIGLKTKTILHDQYPLLGFN